MATTSPTRLNDDEIARIQDHTLIMGVMGVGTFVLGFFFLVVAIIWFLSYSCAPVIKSVWRGVSTGLFFVAALIMVYAPRTNQYEDTSFEPDIYDYSIIPRITIAVLTSFFAVIAGVMLVIMLGEPKQMSTVDHEYSELWQDD